MDTNSRISALAFQLESLYNKLNQPQYKGLSRTMELLVEQITILNANLSIFNAHQSEYLEQLRMQNDMISQERNQQQTNNQTVRRRERLNATPISSN